MARKQTPSASIAHPPQPPRQDAPDGAMDPSTNDGAESYSATGSGAAKGLDKKPAHTAPAAPHASLPAKGNPGHETDARNPGDTVAGSDGTPPAQQSQR